MKRAICSSLIEPDVCLNRTSVGLKPDNPAWRFISAILPQSNQRGIETWARWWTRGAKFPCLNRTSVGLKLVWILRAGILAGSLNRTSVGLKRKLTARTGADIIGPQSNQRGIETPSSVEIIHILPAPQSNQRGIETFFCYKNNHISSCGLNRTSVGLKRKRNVPQGMATDRLVRTGAGTSSPTRKNRPSASNPAWTSPKSLLGRESI